MSSLFSFEKPKLSKEDFTKFRDFIYDKSGIYFADSKLYFLENRLAKKLRAKGLKKYSEYFDLLRRDFSGKELKELFVEVTTNETSFYRNPPQIDAYWKKVLPEIAAQKKKTMSKNLKIWSSASSTGEEPYTLAILALESKSLFTPGTKIEILASDISQQVLEKAKAGIYDSYTLRNMPKNLISKYFVEKDKKFHIKQEVKDIVKFQYFNLIDYSSYLRLGKMDIIFCRNVLIYFDENVKRQVIDSFYNILNKDGYLFIGHSESLHNISKKFELIHFMKALAYKKP
jgi:chemotaxis protein methyltransferase CheR